MFGFIAVFGVIYLAIIALMIVSMWKIFVKMGAPGWACLIPFYSAWVLIERLRKPRSWFWILMLCWLIFMVLYAMLMVLAIGAERGGAEPLGGIMLIALTVLAVYVVMVVYAVKITHALSKAFGQEVGFTLGLILLPVVFCPVLAFGPYRFLLDDAPAAEV